MPELTKPKTPESTILPQDVYEGYIRMYVLWGAMIQRCHQATKGNGYKNYRGRGISVCERWRGENGFDNFLRDMGLRPSPKHSLDRIDFNGNYEPANCRWATPKEQARNRRGNRHISVRGVTATISEWSEISGIGTSTICQRLYKHKWSEEDAVSLPVRGSGITQRELAAKYGLTKGAVQHHLRKGLTLEQVADLFESRKNKSNE